MDLVDSYRDGAGAKKMVDETVKTYKKLYKALGIESK